MSVNPKPVIDKFEAEHGGPSAAVRSIDGNWFFYPDGARRESNPMGALIDPPDNILMAPYHGNQDRLDLEVLQRKIDYWTAKVHNLVEAHERLRESMMGNDYSDSQLKELELMGRAVKGARGELDSLQAERAENPIMKEREAHRATEADRQQRIEQKKSVLKQMRV